MHDVGDAKFHNGVERSAEFAQDILRSLHVEQETIDHVSQIVDNISFRKGDTAAELSLEGKIVQDADRLDALAGGDWHRKNHRVWSRFGATVSHCR
ncbi:MAG: hypothetical protein R3C53_13120 [Pirellulaceae bacterium]